MFTEKMFGAMERGSKPDLSLLSDEEIVGWVGAISAMELASGIHASILNPDSDDVIEEALKRGLIKACEGDR